MVPRTPSEGSVPSERVTRPELLNHRARHRKEPSSTHVLPSRPATFITAALTVVVIAAIAFFVILRPSSSNDFESSIDSPATNFLVRDGKFDCTTVYDAVPIGVLQQVPGLLTSRSNPSTSNATTLPGGGTSCSVSFIATGDNAGLAEAEAAALVTLRNTLNLLRLPLDYRSFVLSTSRTCKPLALDNRETLPAPANNQWELGQTRADANAPAAALIRLDDDRLGCLTAFISFPEGDITEMQSATARQFLKKFANAAGKPLSRAISAAKSDKANHSFAPTPTFSHDGVLDCRSYIFSSSLNQQRETGLASDLSRIPGDFVFADSADDATRETPLYKIADDGSAVTCWFTSATGTTNSLPTDIRGAIPVSATSTSPDDDVALPHSVPVAELAAVAGMDVSVLEKWRYFLYLPGVSDSLSSSHSPLEIELSRVASLNLYRCHDANQPAAGQNCLMLSTPLSYGSEGLVNVGGSESLSPDNLRVLADVATRVERLLDRGD